MAKLLKKMFIKLFGSKNTKILAKYSKLLQKINSLENQFTKFSDEEITNYTKTLKEQLANQKSLDEILPFAFANCREASKRALSMRHFDVQILGAIALHNGKIAEMKTGEGKTLVATLVAYLNALTGSGVHIITVNDYLAKRDAEHLSPLYNMLGISVGINLTNSSVEDKKHAYASCITYGTNNEFGFDYLRDNMVNNNDHKVQRGLNFAIIDEVDSILIDEARTPLIISGAISESSTIYEKLNKIPSKLIKQSQEKELGDFWVDEKQNNIVISDAGHEKIEQLLIDMQLLNPDESLYNIANSTLLHHVIAAIKAHYLFFIDQHYVVKDNQVIIVDEFTGRMMHGRRWSDGIHQAIEAKEGVNIQKENKTLASITFQNYFRLYSKLAGMTGTASTESYEFDQIYNLEVVAIPTNQPMIRIDYNDEIYINSKSKYNAIIKQIKECHDRLQPVLIGTTSVESSELIAKMLNKEKLKHNVLNAKYHEKEASIIAEAGMLGAITVATNMAGRGTDIILGGSDKTNYQEWEAKHQKVLEVGGLFIIGTERHESRRIDNQLRGRSGRQGDPGMSKFYLSLDDQLLRIFGGERISSLVSRLGVKDDEVITHKMISRAIEMAQKKVEFHNFDIRRQLLDYDDVINQQRKVIYHQRNAILSSNDPMNIMFEIIKAQLEKIHHLIQAELANQTQYNKKTNNTYRVSEQNNIETQTGNHALLQNEHEDLVYLFDQELKFNHELKAMLHEKTLPYDKLCEAIICYYRDKCDKIKRYYIEQFKANQGVENNLTQSIKNKHVKAKIGTNNPISTQSINQPETQNSQNSQDALIRNPKNTTTINQQDINEQNKQDINLELNYQQIIEKLANEKIDQLQKDIMLREIDMTWQEHINNLNHLKQGIHLRGYAQKNPKEEYRMEAFILFEGLLATIQRNITSLAINFIFVENR